MTNTTVHLAYLGFGSNLGDRIDTIARAIDALRDTKGVRIDPERDVAGMYETEPIDAPAGSPPFLNTVVRVATALGPVALLNICHDIESRLGRVRTTPNAPRMIDIDVLLFDDRVINTPTLVIPHPRLHQRRFVLEPLAELAPQLVHPVLGVAIGALATQAGQRFSDQRVEPHNPSRPSPAERLRPVTR